MRCSLFLVDRRGDDARVVGCENFGIFLVERLFSIAMNFFCLAALVRRAWRADEYVVLAGSTGVACGGFRGRSVRWGTLGRGTGCEFLGCTVVIGVTLGGGGMGVTLGGRAVFVVLGGVTVGAGTLGSGAVFVARGLGVAVCAALSVAVVPKISLSFWRFCRVTVSSVGRRLSWSVAVRAAVSSWAAARMRASLEAMGILMSYAGNHFKVWTMRSAPVPGNHNRWQR